MVLRRVPFSFRRKGGCPRCAKTNKVSNVFLIFVIQKEKVMKRHHELTKGELVYDYRHGVIGRVKWIDGNQADDNIVLSAVPANDSELKDLFGMACNEELLSKEKEWSVENVYVYQYAPEFRTVNSGDVVCWEHARETMEDQYPFFCPANDENYFSFECERVIDPYMSEIAEWGEEFDEHFKFVGPEEDKEIYEQAQLEFLNGMSDGRYWDAEDFALDIPESIEYVK